MNFPIFFELQNRIFIQIKINCYIYPIIVCLFLLPEPINITI